METPIAFYPELARKLNSIEATVFYQYLVSCCKGQGEYVVYQTKEIIQKETTLNRYQQDKAREILEEAGWVRTFLSKEDGAPVLHYEILIMWSLERSTRISSPSTNGLAESSKKEENEKKVPKEKENKKNPVEEEKRDILHISPKKNENSPDETRLLDVILEDFAKLFLRKYRPTIGRQKKLKDRLKNFTFEEIREAIKNMAKDKFYQGKNDRGWCADPDFFLRNDEKIDKFLQISKKIHHGPQTDF